jgi:hypothetical protein
MTVFRGSIRDVSLTHPFVGNANDLYTWGNYKPTALKDRVEEEDCNNLQWCNRWGYMFLPLVCSTFGAISNDTLQLLFYFAHSAAVAFTNSPGESLYDNKGQLMTRFVQHQTSLYTCFKSRIALEVCRGRAVRGSLGNSGTVCGYLDEVQPIGSTPTTLQLRQPQWLQQANRDYGWHTPLYQGRLQEGAARGGR